MSQGRETSIAPQYNDIYLKACLWSSLRRVMFPCNVATNGAHDFWQLYRIFVTFISHFRFCTSFPVLCGSETTLLINGEQKKTEKNDVPFPSNSILPCSMTLPLRQCDTSPFCRTKTECTHGPVWPQSRGVTRLDSARGKKQVWRPMFEAEIFRKQMYCVDESTCDSVGTFRRFPQWFDAPIATRRPGIAPLVTPLLQSNSMLLQHLLQRLARSALDWTVSTFTQQLNSGPQLTG